MATSPSILDADLARCTFYRLPPRVPVPSPSAIEAAGRAAGLPLPADFVDFCGRHGAGAFDDDVMLGLPAGCALGPEFCVDILYGIGGDPDRDALVQATDTYADRLPADMLPVGSDPGGNLLLLGCGTRTGVFAWDHEHRELAPGDFDRRVDELKRIGIDVGLYDIDQLLWLWDERFPERVSNPTGYGNLYPVADSFTSLCAAFVPQPD
jgi:hypothetical protein